MRQVGRPGFALGAAAAAVALWLAVAAAGVGTPSGFAAVGVSSVHASPIERDRGSGRLQRVRCAPGGQAGAQCFIAAAAR